MCSTYLLSVVQCRAGLSTRLRRPRKLKLLLFLTLSRSDDGSDSAVAGGGYDGDGRRGEG